MNKFVLSILIISLLGGVFFLQKQTDLLQNNIFVFSPQKNREILKQNTLEDYLRVQTLDGQQHESLYEIEALWSEFISNERFDTPAKEFGYAAKQTQALKTLETEMKVVFDELEKLSLQAEKNNDLTEGICQKQDAKTPCD